MRSPTVEASALNPDQCRFESDRAHQLGLLAQLVEASVSETECSGFESLAGHHYIIEAESMSPMVEKIESRLWAKRLDRMKPAPRGGPAHTTFSSLRAVLRKPKKGRRRR